MVDPEFLKGLEVKCQDIQTSFNDTLKQFQFSMQSDKKDVDDRVNRFVSKLRRERNDFVCVKMELIYR